MNWIKTMKKQTHIMILVIVLLVALATGVSFAFYMQSRSNSTNQTVHSGTLDVEYSSTNGYITGNTYNELLPMSDSDGLEQTGYSFSVRNTGSLPVSYKVYLYIDYASYQTDLDNSAVDGDIFEDLTSLSFNIETNNVEDNTVRKVGNISQTSTININNAHQNVVKYQIYSGNINSSNGVDNHVLKLWLDENTDPSEIGKYIYLKLEVNTEVNDN